MRTLLVCLVAGMSAALLLLPLSPLVQCALLFLVAAITWCTPALPHTSAMLLIPALALALGLVDWAGVGQVLLSPIFSVFLFSFLLAALFRDLALDRIALNNLLVWSSGSERRAAVALLISSGLLSMWTSNTAAASLMLPVALAIGGMGQDSDNGRFLAIGVIYSIVYWGVTTFAGSKVNLLVAGATDFDFVGWMALTIPLVSLLWALSMAWLWWLYRPRFAQVPVPAGWQWTNLKQSLAVAVVALTLVSWALVGIHRPDARGLMTAIPLAGALAFLLLGLIGPKRAWQAVNWRILAIFVASMVLGKIASQVALGQVLFQWTEQFLGQLGPIAVILGVILLVLVLTEFISNFATAALVTPILVSYLAPMGLGQGSIALLLGVVCASAFVLPSATPAMGMLHASGAVRQRELSISGLPLKLMVLVAMLLVVIRA
ncbi:SLC13 family permease [Ferrimonas marina]|uniref:SLC13 family permease n=1 Tax=Ferrimonas marina TaxID=299255 RepID=UPI0013565D75|nr:SLC13 family permease [Ferrimonas marina]